MTKQEAIEAMRQRKKVTHSYFTDDEFIKMEKGKIVTEEGYSAPPEEFWKYRQSVWWNEGWELFEEKDTTKHLCNKHGDLDDAGAYAEDDKD